MSSNIFGISEAALKLCEDRSVLLTNNIANSSTPHYKARDIDFHKILQGMNETEKMEQATGQQQNKLKTSEQVLYRVPTQQSVDGNTVDHDLERKNFIENALHYQVNLTFVQNKTNELMAAIKDK